MSLEEELLQMETGFWRDAGDGAFHRRHLADEAVMAFAPTGVLTREQVLTGVAGAVPWVDFELQEPRVVPLAEKSALFVYRAWARREGDASAYRAFVSSIYVREGASWKLAFHQHTPLT